MEADIRAIPASLATAKTWPDDLQSQTIVACEVKPTGLTEASSEFSALSGLPTCSAPSAELGHCVAGELECASPMAASPIRPSATSAEFQAYFLDNDALEDTSYLLAGLNTSLAAVTDRTRSPSKRQSEALGAIRARLESIPLQ